MSPDTSTTTATKSDRLAAATALVRSMRTGERAAALSLGRHLAEDVLLISTMGGALGRDEVLHRLSGQWAFTPTLARAVWTRPRLSDDDVEVAATFPGLGAAPDRLAILVSFADDGPIARIDQRWELGGAASPLAELPDHVASAIDRALANGTPIVLCYVDATGVPRPSLRGSVQVSGPMQLSIWVRKASGGLVDALAVSSNVSLLYRDSASRTTLTIVGRAAVSTDPATRDATFERSPEVEQNHDPSRSGAAVLIDIDRVTGTSPFGPVLVERPVDVDATRSSSHFSVDVRS